MEDEKEELLDRLQELTGAPVPNVRYLLRVLSHPDVIKYTRHYFDSLDESTRCQKYEAPWSCAREAEARYENIKYGWLGAGNGVGYSEWWCEPCRAKVMNSE